MGSFSSVPYSVGFDADRDRIMTADAISPTAVHFGVANLLCTMISEADIYLAFPWS